MGTPTRRRLRAPDHLKAILLILVIYGHTYGEGVSEDLGKYVIYGFHMPMFLMLSGYLLSIDRLSKEELPKVGRHYWSRMLWQWLVVSIAFEFYMGGFRGDSLSESLWLMVAEPRFHLWFIPALLIAVLLIWLMAPLRMSRVTLGTIFLAGYFLYSTPLRNSLDMPDGFDPRFIGYGVFVWLGVESRRLAVPTSLRVWASSVAILGGGTLYLVGFYESGWYKALGFLIFNLGIMLVLPGLLRLLERRVPILTTAAVLIATYSLWVYLLHPFATEAFRVEEVGSESGMPERLLVTGVVVVIAVVLTWLWDTVGVRARHTSESRQSESVAPWARQHKSSTGA